MSLKGIKASLQTVTSSLEKVDYHLQTATHNDNDIYRLSAAINTINTALLEIVDYLMNHRDKFSDKSDSLSDNELKKDEP
jgi:hypothetical protein